uniref:Uncharacterized protein n=1 Tax=Arundo donax TaxID=35708 RepID=A0A0A9DTY4_ARUDO
MKSRAAAAAATTTTTPSTLSSEIMMEMGWLPPLDNSHSIHLWPHCTPTLVRLMIPGAEFLS